MSPISFEPTRYFYTFGPHPPALVVDPGRIITAPTIDSDNRDHRGIPLLPAERPPESGLLEGNPVTGPFFISGAEPGDTLVVKIKTIELTRDDAFGAVQAHLAVLGDDLRFVGPTGLKPPITGRRYDWKLDRDAGVGRLSLPGSRIGAVEIPLHPFLGCIGVAPRWGEVIHTVDAGPHGGNLDCADLSSGAEVHFPVNVPGGLLMFGDAHAAQGDGELAGGALETTAQVTFACDVIKHRPLRWPRIIHDDWLITLASGRPLIDALRIAWSEMILWLQADYGYDRWDALHVLSQVGQVRVCNAVSPSYTVAAKFPRKLCPEPSYQPGTDADLFDVSSYPRRPLPRGCDA